MKCRSNEITPGLTIVPRLKYEHIHLTNFSKMRVDLAAQVCCVHAAWYRTQPQFGSCIGFEQFSGQSIENNAATRGGKDG